MLQYCWMQGQRIMASVKLVPQIYCAMNRWGLELFWFLTRLPQSFANSRRLQSWNATRARWVIGRSVTRARLAIFPHAIRRELIENGDAISNRRGSKEHWNRGLYSSTHFAEIANLHRENCIHLHLNIHQTALTSLKQSFWVIPGSRCNGRRGKLRPIKQHNFIKKGLYNINETGCSDVDCCSKIYTMTCVILKQKGSFEHLHSNTLFIFHKAKKIKVRIKKRKSSR